MTKKIKKIKNIDVKKYNVYKFFISKPPEIITDKITNAIVDLLVIGKEFELDVKTASAILNDNFEEITPENILKILNKNNIYPYYEIYYNVDPMEWTYYDWQ